MNCLPRTAIVAGIVAGLAGSASAGFTENITFSFSDPIGQREWTQVAPAQVGSDGVMTYNSAVVINLSVDLSDFGLGGFTIPVYLNSTVNVLAASSAGPNSFSASTIGNWTFTRVSDNAPLIIGSYQNAALNLVRTGGGLAADGQINMGNFNVSFTPAFVSELAGEGLAFGGFDTARTGDASWTLTNVSPAPSLVTPQGGSQTYISSFAANSSFSATIPIVPTPGAATLAFAAGFIALGKRRR